MNITRDCQSEDCHASLAMTYREDSPQAHGAPHICLYNTDASVLVMNSLMVVPSADAAIATLP